MSAYRGREPLRDDEVLPITTGELTPRGEAIANVITLTIIVVLSVLVASDEPFFGAMFFASQGLAMFYALYLHARIERWKTERTARKIAKALYEMDAEDASRVRVASKTRIAEAQRETEDDDDFASAPRIAARK